MSLYDCDDSVYCDISLLCVEDRWSHKHFVETMVSNLNDPTILFFDWRRYPTDALR